IVATVVVVVATHDLAKGVLTGVLLSAVFFTRKVAKLVQVASTLSEGSTERRYRVQGQIFSASADAFAGAFDRFERLPISDERRVGKECVMTCRSRELPD